MLGSKMNSFLFGALLFWPKISGAFPAAVTFRVCNQPLILDVFFLVTSLVGDRQISEPSTDLRTKKKLLTSKTHRICLLSSCFLDLLNCLVSKSLDVQKWMSKISQRIHGTGTFTYIWLIFMVNVGKYTIHGSYGYEAVETQQLKQKPVRDIPSVR